jgi:hypothetical protein
MDSIEHIDSSRVVCKKMKIDKMANARILSRTRTSAEIALVRNLRASILFAGTERARHREIRHDVEDEGRGGSTAGSFSG